MLSFHLADSFQKYSAHPALDCDGQRLSYAELMHLALELAEDVRRLPPGPVGLLGGKSLACYTSILACLFAGRAYVPLNIKFPASRLAEMASTALCGAILIDDKALPVLSAFLGALPNGALWRPFQLNLKLAAHPVLHGVIAPSQEDAHESSALKLEGLAYILFTSGSTGTPKGIGISADNLLAYLHHAVPAFGPGPGDRASQMFDLTFDLSVHDMFVTWLGGGELCVPSESSMLAPARYVVDKKLTHWFSVPSVVSVLSRLRMLKKNVFPELRQSLFCGEALPAGSAALWQEAAPQSSVWNLYGPTEATIAITQHRYEGQTGDWHVVPIGRPFPHHRVRVVANGNDVAAGDLGELWLNGAQVVSGYLNHPEKSREAFVTDAAGDHWYRTGDLVRSGLDGDLRYVGRLDSQIQLHGFRVELGEVEVGLRKATGGDACAVIPWPVENATVGGIVAFVEGSGDATAADEIRRQCEALLPIYMVPSRVLFIDNLPKNANGKIDRKALTALLS